MTTRTLELYATQIFVEGYPKSRQASYKYMLIEQEKEIEYLDRKVSVPCFGIEIVREDFDGDRIYYTERNKIECMTIYRYKVVQLIKKFYENCVSPIHLVDIAGSAADEWVSDFDEALTNMQAQ